MATNTKKILFTELVRYTYGYIARYSDGVTRWEWERGTAYIQQYTTYAHRRLKYCVFRIPSEYKNKSIRLYLDATWSVSNVCQLSTDASSIELMQNKVEYDTSTMNWFLKTGTSYEFAKEIVLPYWQNGYQVNVSSKLDSTSSVSFENSYLEVDITTPEIDNFNVAGTSIDSDIICSWEQKDVTSWEVQAIQDNNIVRRITGTSESTCTFALGSFSKSGTTIFKIIAYYDDSSIEVSQTVELTQITPQIIAIEPNGVLKLLTNPIDIEFTGTNITSFVMNVYQNNVKKFTYSGTTERTITIMANIFSNGTVSIEIIAKYVGASYETSTTRTVSFTAYGPPQNPVVNVDENYHTPFPLIKWSSSEQLSYQLKIGALDTGEIYSNDKMYQVNEALENHTYYQVSIRVKNQYNLWSSWVTASIYIDFAELTQPEFNIYADTNNACIVLNVQSQEDVDFNYHELYRREKSGIWVRIATNLGMVAEYHDFSCASNTSYDYKVRAITTEGGYTDSVTKEMSCNFKGNILSVPFTDISFNVRYSKEESGIQKSTALTVDRKFVVYCGCEKPKETRGLTKYKQFSLSTTFKTLDEYRIFEELANERILLFRDNKGTKAYCSMIITGITDEKTFYATVDLALTEVYYKEGDYSEDESRPLRFVDEEW